MNASTIPPVTCNPRLLVGLAAGVVLLVAGCGRPSHLPELGYVSGVVTLDGRPLSQITVYFEPGRGRPSVGTTDAQGQYTLEFAGGYKGALLGRHTVHFRPARQVPNEDGSIRPPSNQQPPLAAEVKQGQNTFNFDLSSKPAGSQ